MGSLGAKIQVRQLSVTRDGARELSDVSFDVRGGAVTVVLGAAGSSKTALLKALTRLHLDGSVRVSGSVEVGGQEIYGRDVDLAALHRRVGMVSSVPWLFPGSIATNVAYGLRVAGTRSADKIGHAVETSLRLVGLWSRLRMNLDRAPTDLAPEDQQRLCIARTLALEPEVLLLDDPARDLDHLGRRRIEEMLTLVRARTTVVLATRDVRHAAALADDMVFISRGRVVETGTATQVLGRPIASETVEYIEGST